MKDIRDTIRKVSSSILAAGLLGFAGCEPRTEPGAPLPVDPDAAEDEEEVEEAVEEDEEEQDDDGEDGEDEAVFEISADDSMRFGLTAFEVEPGREVTVVLENIGETPVETMGHNFVLLDLGTDVTAFANDAIPHGDNDFIPPEREDEVLAATRILGPGESERLTFTAPEIPGEYDFICSFPGHAPAGMVGVMTVREKDE